MDFETILYDTDGPIAFITLNRPERLNTIVPPMPDEFEAAIHAAAADPAVKVVVVQGAGRSFCAGYDFSGGFRHWDSQISTDGRWDPGKDFVFATFPQFAPTQKFMSMWRCPKPVIAQVHGWCVGGGSDTALCADLVIASEDARIGTPYARMWGCYLSGMWLYRLGLTRAKEYALTGKPLSGKEAAEIGLINKAVPFARLQEEVRRTALQLASIPALAALGHEAHREPRVGADGPLQHPDPRPDPRRPHAQHAGRAPVHRARRARGGRRGHRRAGRTVRRLQPGATGRAARSHARHPSPAPRMTPRSLARLTWSAPRPSIPGGG